MAFEPSVAVFDACILYPFHLRNVLVQAAVDRLVEARWTDEIHDEWIRNLAARAPGVPIERLQNTRRLMNDAVPTAMVSGYENHVPKVNLPDPDDCHVVAAGIAAGASIILTWNLRHFPMKELKKFGLRSGDAGRVPVRPLRQSPGFGDRLSRECPTQSDQNPRLSI